MGKLSSQLNIWHIISRNNVGVGSEHFCCNDPASLLTYYVEEAFISVIKLTNFIGNFMYYLIYLT